MRADYAVLVTQVFNYLFGSLTRIYTTLQEVDDRLILYGFVGGFVMNVVLAAQMVGSREKWSLNKRERSVLRSISLTIHRSTIGIVQQLQRMRERLVRSRPRWLWAPAAEPR